MSEHQTDRHRPRRPRVPLGLVLAVTVVGLVLIVIAVVAQVSAPAPPRSLGSIDVEPSPSPSATVTSPAPADPSRTAKAPLPASPPVTISIPSIDLTSEVKPIGLAPDGTLAVPQPGPDQDLAAWFTRSPTPGQPGPSIIEGHVDTTSGPSVFFQLGKLRPGDQIRVTRKDGIVAVFTVNAVRDYAKSSFPTETVYGARDLSRPELRLITCSDFNAATGHHEGNEVVFAHLTGTHHAR